MPEIVRAGTLSMAGYQIRKMNWTQTPSAYESMQTWRAKRQAAQEEYQATSNATMSALASAQNDQGYAIGEIAANRALKRMQDEAKAKQAKALAAVASRQNQINPPKQSSFAYNDSVTVGGGAKIDFGSNTITHTDGTVVDLKTGLKVNVTV